jgi:hypothetical protein
MNSSNIKIGWAQTDITPQELPVYIAGQFHARVSEGTESPLMATALALESGGEHAVFVCLDAVGVSDELRDATRAHLNEDGLDPQKVIFHVTHTHEAPLNRITPTGSYQMWGNEKDEMDSQAQPPQSYIAFASAKIAAAIREAWQNRAPGGVAFGLDYAVIGRNRRWVDKNGVSTMYGLDENSAERFDHIEGFEDHSLNLLATYDDAGVLTGVVVNIPSPSQETEHLFELSADFWHETRRELRARFGENLFILPQVSAAGELTSHLIFEKPAHERMLELRGRTGREEVAQRIADAVGRVLPIIAPTIESAPLLQHQHETLQLPMNQLRESDVEDAHQNIAQWQEKYEAAKQKLAENPALKNEPRWYVPITQALNRIGWYRGVLERYEQLQRGENTYLAEVHILRLGDIAFATNPFEYYLDFGIQIKVKSPAIQTFVVQLAGNGTYVPSPRAAVGGGYGAVPASNPVGPQGGQVLANYTVEQIGALWEA